MYTEIREECDNKVMAFVWQWKKHSQFGMAEKLKCLLVFEI